MSRYGYVLLWIVSSKDLACVSHVETLLYNLKVRVKVVYDIFKSFV
jgi:hypothetical protein